MLALDRNPQEDSHDQWDASAYDESHSFVFEYGANLLELLDSGPEERILDLGCGTGHLTSEIAETGASVVGVDQSREMIETARAEHPECRFVRADARALPFEGRFDAVFSNAALHWITQHDRLLESVASVLHPGGRFVAELGATGNVRGVTEAVRAAMEHRSHEMTHPWYFPSVGEYTTRLEAHGFDVRYAALFDRPTELDGGKERLATWLAMFGDELLSPLSPTERDAVVATVEDDLREECFADGTWTIDYRRLRFVATRVAK